MTTEDEVDRPARQYERSRPRKPKQSRSVDQTENSLRQTARNCRAIWENTSDGIFLHDLETRRLVMGNKACLQMLGYTEQEFRQLSVADIHSEADLPFIYAQIDTFLQGGKPIRRDIRFRRKDGSILFADVSPDLVRLDGKQYVMVAMKDITERKRMEEELRRHAEHLGELVEARTRELRESETKYRSLYHTIADGVFVIGADGWINDVNDSACAQLGYTREELVGMPVSAVSARADFDLAKLFDRLRADDSLSYETTHLRKDGAVLPVELSIALIEYQGRPAILGVARDITERKRAEEALRFTQFAVDHTADAAFWMTQDGRFFYVNEAACQALGYSRDELLKLTVYDIDPAFTESMWIESWARLKAAKSIILETLHRTRDGRVFPVEIRANYVESGGREYDCAFARDITERKRAEEALRDSEARHRRLVENLKRSHFVYTHDTDGVFRYVSESLTGILGYTPEEFKGHYGKYLTDHPANAAVHQHTDLTIQGIPQPPYEVNTWHKDGSTRWLEVQEVPVFDEGGRVVAVEGVAQDITDRKRAEEALLESEERYRILLERSFDGILVHENFRLVQLNDRFADMTGYTRSELLGSDVIELFVPDSQERIRQYVPTEAGGCYGLELKHRDGHIVQVESFGTSCKFQGRAARIVALRDVTERKRAEETLRESEERFRTAFEEGPVAMALTGLDTTLLKVNSSFCRMLGFSEAELVGRSFARITHPDDLAANLVGTRGLAGGELPSFHMEKRYIRKDNAIVWGDMHTASVRDARGRPLYYVTHVQDITDRKEAEEALRRLNERLEQQVAQRTEALTHTVARLQQLTWELSQTEDRERKRIADLLHDDVQQILAGARFHLNLLSLETRSVQESQEIIHLVRQMLKDAIEKARSLSHELSPALYQVDLMDILNWLGDHMQRKHGLTVRVTAHSPVEPSSEPLKALLYKVTQELLFNVVKHAGVKEARVRVRRAGQYICLEVTDHGLGFDPQELEETAGFGLLSIRERVHLLGGRMKIKSAPGMGSRFLIAVPDAGPSQPVGTEYPE